MFKICSALFCFRFDISFPAFQYCKSFYSPDRRMVCGTEALGDADVTTTVDILSTAHLGMFALYMGGRF